MKKKNKLKKQTILPLRLTVLLGLVFSVLSAILVLAIQPTSLGALFGQWPGAPVLFLLNLWPIAALLLLFYFLCGNLFFSAAGANFIWGLLSCINLVKLEARNDPFVPGDIALFFEGAKAAGSYDINLHWGWLCLLLGISVGLILLGTFFKSPPLRRSQKLAGVAVTLGLFLLSMPLLYMNKTIYNELPGPNRANVPLVFAQFGFPYCFLHNINLYPVDKPPSFSLSQAETYDETYRAPLTTPENPPHVVMVMAESFSDLPNASTFSYGAQNNPIAPFNELASRPDTISGHLVVSNTGAGTANTEFDVLTGMMTNRLGTGTTSAFRVLRRNTASVPQALAGAGYHTFLLHPGTAWFYNRENVYSYLGVPDQVFSEAFSDADKRGKWVTDASFLRVLEENLNLRTADGPLFTYGITIQNHQAYTYEKYDDHPEDPQSNLTLTAEEKESLSVYFEGLHDTASMLNELTKYLKAQPEPYLLVFFGDHQPTLLGIEHTLADVPQDPVAAKVQPYTVPFLIWGNAAFQQNQNLIQAGKAIGLEDGQTISSQYLGALTCRLAGFQGIDGYFDYLTDLYRQLPVSSVYGNLLADGTWTETLPDDLQAKEDLRQNWQYYRLKYQKVE